uniref:Spindle and kinetochore-associated protein 1 n=1 Tax=Heterorhabditis bacteriophora TaxID=37862 RepID=A0A1I7W614_HETBA
MASKTTSAEPNTTSVLFEMKKFSNMVSEEFNKIHRKLEEIMLRQRTLEIRCTRSVHVEDMISSTSYFQLFSSNKLHIDDFQYTLMPAARVENIRKIRRNPRKFAFVLEKELYANDACEIELNVDDRKITADKVAFIQEVMRFSAHFVILVFLSTHVEKCRRFARKHSISAPE